MKKLLPLFISINCLAQSATWSKDDRNNLFEDCLSYCVKYKNITNEQKESISLCYLEEITKKYDKSEFQTKIDIEIKRIRDAQIGQCAKNIGVDLSTQAPTPAKEEVVEEEEANLRQMLIGRWKTDDNAIIEFKSDGTYLKKYLVQYQNPVTEGLLVDNIMTGDWFLDEKGALTIRTNWKEDIGKRRKVKIQAYTNSTTYKFTSFSTEYIKFENQIPGYMPIQANRVN